MVTSLCAAAAEINEKLAAIPSVGDLQPVLLHRTRSLVIRGRFGGTTGGH